MKVNRKRWLILVVVIIAVAAGGLLGVSWVQRRGEYLARKSWAEQAISEITRLADDSDWVSEEIATLENSTSAYSVDKWLSDHMILMATGEWLIYKSHCHKIEPHNVKDIFIARGSDGKWYYSTFHFCVGMVVIMDNLQPESIPKFAADHFLREFDGRSDECLQKTW